MIKLSSRTATLLGLCIALLAGPGIIALQSSLFGPVKDVPSTFLREALLWMLAGLLILIITHWERLPLASVGLTPQRKGRTALLGVGITVALGVGAVAVLMLLHLAGLPAPNPGFVPPPLVFTLIVIRAGVIEEFFYRGYAIERLEFLTGNKWIAGIVPLVCFTVAHFKGGLSGMAIALVLGAILTAFYMWKRNLAANIFGHFLIDFIPNILLPALSAL